MTSWAIERFRLPNGLRVVLAPAHSTPVAGVAVVYDVGSRSEPEDRSGFAHLFEHLAFQGSLHFPKSAHAALIQGAGGAFNATTGLDHTEYHAAMPADGLAVALELEADRMRGLLLTEENLHNQVEVVAEEIRTNVLNKPYGGFPGTWLAPVLFDTFANAHDGYGSFEDLRAATLDDAADFFDRYYAPGNAVLCVTGDFAVDQVTSSVHELFGGIPPRSVPERPNFDEPGPATTRHAQRHDRLAPLPAVAAARRVPDPADLAAYLPFHVLASVLRDGDRGRLFERLVRSEELAVELTAGLGLGGDPFSARAPTAFVLSAILPPGGDAGKVLAVADEEVDRLAHDGVTAEELRRTRRRAATAFLRCCDGVASRAVLMAVLEQQRGDAGLAHRLPRLVEAVTGDDVSAAAAALLSTPAAVLEVFPG